MALNAPLETPTYGWLGGLRSPQVAYQGRPRLISSGTHRPRSRTFRFRILFAGLVLAFSLVTRIVGALPLSNNIALYCRRWLVLRGVCRRVVLAFSVIHRRVAIAVAAATNLVIQVPWYYFGKPPDVREHVDLRVLSANLRLGHADVPSLVDLARASADVITLSGMTPDWLRRFLRHRHPGRVSPFCVGSRGRNPADSACGAGSRSRW